MGAQICSKSHAAVARDNILVQAGSLLKSTFSGALSVQSPQPQTMFVLESPNRRDELSDSTKLGAGVRSSEFANPRPASGRPPRPARPELAATHNVHTASQYTNPPSRCSSMFVCCGLQAHLPRPPPGIPEADPPLAPTGQSRVSIPKDERVLSTRPRPGFLSIPKQGPTAPILHTHALS